MRRALFVVLFCGTTASGCGEEAASSYCDADELKAALDDARAGDAVRVGACEVVGTLTVPAGVTLGGEGEDSSRVVAPADGIAIVVEVGSAPTAVEDLTVVAPSGARGGIAVFGEGSGEVALRRLRIEATTGTALGVEGVASLSAEAVSLQGPVTAANAAADACLEDLCTPEEADDPRAERRCSTIDELRTCTATHGLAVVEVADAILTDVSTTGFAVFGALLLDSGTTWRGGSASENLTTGLMVHGGTATLENLEVGRTIAGLRLVPAYGAVFAADAEVTTLGLRVIENENFGLLQNHATASHQDLVASDNQLAAVWIQDSSGFALRGGGTLLSGNTLGGVIAVDSSNVTIEGDGPAQGESVSIQSTLGFDWPYDNLSQPHIGDGIQLLRSTVGIVVRDVRLEDNERVGVLVDIGDETMDGVTLEGVVAESTGAAHGVMAQGSGGVVAPGVDGWDDGVERQGDAEANDVAGTTVLPTLPSSLPASKIPTVGDALSDGLRGIMGPSF